MAVRRRTHMLTARLHRPTLNAISAAAKRMGETVGLTVEALVAVALRHEDEVRTEIRQRREGEPENQQEGAASVLQSG